MRFILKFSTAVAILVLLGIEKSYAMRGWLVEDFPDPKDGGFVVDPDRFLNAREADDLAEKIQAVEARVKESTPNQLDLQIVVAIVGKVSRQPSSGMCRLSFLTFVILMFLTIALSR